MWRWASVRRYCSKDLAVGMELELYGMMCDDTSCRFLFSAGAVVARPGGTNTVFHTHSEDDDEGPPLSGPLSKNLTGQMHDWTLDLARISLELVKKELFFSGALRDFVNPTRKNKCGDRQEGRQRRILDACRQIVYGVDMWNEHLNWKVIKDTVPYFGNEWVCKDQMLDRAFTNVDQNNREYDHRWHVKSCGITWVSWVICLAHQKNLERWLFLYKASRVNSEVNPSLVPLGNSYTCLLLYVLDNGRVFGLTCKTRSMDTQSKKRSSATLEIFALKSGSV